MAVNTTIGHPARGDEYFERSQLTDKLWEKIRSGSSILLAAPRRVGKSSIMFYLEDNPSENFRPTYMDTESVNNENEYYKKLSNLIITTLSKITRYSKMAANFTKDLAARIEAIGAEGITIGESRLNYYDEFVKLVKSLDLKGERFIIMVDEFAETVYIQVIIDEIDKLEFGQETKIITEKEIDAAFLRALEHRNYFSNWHTRLRRAYKGKEYTFVKGLLNYVSENDTVTSGEIRKLAAEFEIEDEFVNILNALKYDGYINNHDDPKLYRFNSPLLKMWWNKNVAN